MEDTRTVTRIPAPANVKTVSKTENDLDQIQRDRAYAAAKNISGAFAWDKTAEGYEFWHAVYGRLYNISKGQVLK